MIIPTPLPTFIPHSSTNSQLLEIIKQIRGAHSASVGMILLGLLMIIPLPKTWWTVEARLGLYKFLLSHFAFLSAPIPVYLLLVILMFGPVGILLILGLSIFLLYKLIKGLVPVIFSFLGIVKNQVEPQAFLELTFPSNTTKSAYATEQLYKLLHRLSVRHNFAGLFGIKKTYSLEIAAARDFGIRYILVVPKRETEVIHRSLLSYLPGLKVNEIPDYLDGFENIFTASSSHKKTLDNTKTVGVVELKQSFDFALPLQDQKILTEHDSISFLVGNMTKLAPGELVSFQIVTTPLLSGIHNGATGRIQELRDRIYKGLPLTPVLQKSSPFPLPSFILFFLSPLVGLGVLLFKFLISIPALVFSLGSKDIPILQTEAKVPPQQILNPYEQELSAQVKEKTDQQLFETSIRMLIVAKSDAEFETRADGLYASLGQFSSPHQELRTKEITPLPLFSFFARKSRLVEFRQRTLSGGLFNQNPIISTSEISDLYHFPYTDITKTEGLVKLKSKELPAPLSFKKSTTHLDVVVGKNTYGGEETPIGLTSIQRGEHTYILGKTGSGKTTIIKKMAYQDIENGKGLAVIDIHGDMVKELIRIIPESRKKDIIYLDLTDKDFPFGLNVLIPGYRFKDKEDADDQITGSLLSVFQRITPKHQWGQRMEHILRNATLTALQIPYPTEITPYISLMTIQKLLTDKSYQRQATANLKDPVLKQFWNKEFHLFGTRQQAEVISPLTNKLGEFFTSPPSRNILLQEKSTIDLQKIMDEGKILLVNLSKGELGEERASFFGTLLISLFQMAAYQRARIPENKRRDFYLYIDEFQNFATDRFADLFSEARKFHVFIIPSHQNVAQIEEVKTAEVVLSNSGNIICLQNGPNDEKVILPFMEPEVEKGQIVNLPKYRFFMKVTTETSEDAFTGETLPLEEKGSDEMARFIITNSRKHHATPRPMVEKQLKKLFGIEDEAEERQKKDKISKKQGI